MSESTNEDRKSAVVDADFDEAAYEPEAPSDRAGKGRSGATTSIAWLALFLGLASVAGVGWLAVDDWRADREAGAGEAAIGALRRDMEDTLETTRETLAALEARVETLLVSTRKTGAAIEPLEVAVDEVESQLETLESIAPRLARLERSLADLQGISVDARSRFLLAEAEYYMQIANAQLQLAGNAELALQALRQADDRIAELDEPALTEVRAALADEMAALETLEKPDIAGVTLTLGSLAQVVDSLPLREQNTAEADDPQVPDEEAGAVSRALASIKNAFSGAFDYTPPSDPDRPLLTPGSEPLIRGNLALQLQAARLALLRGEQDLFRQSLDDAESWIATYFDTSTSPVESARATIREIREEYRRIAKPDIAESLRLLRQYQALAESAQ
jgi:uroporphyrin-III C-methyltransferase